MPNSSPQRLGSAHLEDLAIVALSAFAEHRALSLHPDLDNGRRARLRSRLKQIGRHDWPSSLADDPLLRRGYTLRQCCRILAALMLIDAHLVPSEAIALAKANEINLLRAMQSALSAVDGSPSGAISDDMLVVVPLGELISLVADRRWGAAQPQALRLIRRGDLPLLWSDKADLAFPGQRLVLDMGTAAAAMWRWIAGRGLMTSDALLELLAEIDVERRHRGYAGTTAPIPRQR